MDAFRIFIFGSILATTLAVNLEPILPTPVSIERPVNVTKDENNAIEKSNGGISDRNSTVQQITTEEPKTDDSKQPRAMSAAPDAQSYANSINRNVSASNKSELKESGRSFGLNPDLSDISMDSDEMDLEYSEHSSEKETNNTKIYGETRVINKPHLEASIDSFSPLLVPSYTNSKDVIVTSCMDSGKIYKVGEKLERGCEEMCKCGENGRFNCEPRCSGPFFRRGRKIDDPLCSEKPTDDPCCAILVCATNTQDTNCIIGNATYSIGETFHEGCERTCECEAGGSVMCKPRCPVFEHRDECLIVPASNDTCCKIQLCDVSHEIDDTPLPISRDGKKNYDVEDKDSSELTMKKNTYTDVSNSSDEPILSITHLYNGSYQVLFKDQKNPPHLELSSDSGSSWTDIKLNNGLLTDVEAGHNYVIRSKETKKEYKLNLQKESELTGKENVTGCMHKGKHRSIDEEFHMGGCNEICICGADGKVECAPLKCPSTVGLDLIDPNCVQWLPDPPDFVPTYPMCCPPALKCVDNGTCDYEGHMINNWSEVPSNLTGCEKKCFCESGNIECQNVCAPLPAIPPPSLHCEPPKRPAPYHPPGDNCCKEWGCVPPGNDMKLTDSKHKYPFVDAHTPNDTDENSFMPPPIFVTLPPSLHKAIKEPFITPPPDEKSKLNKPGHSNSGPKKSEKDPNKHYEYPGPFADPNHSPPQNGLGSFPFLKKHKDKQIYPHDSDPTISKDNAKKHQDESNDVNKLPPDHDDYPVNDPYLSGNPVHVPFNQNGVGPGYFNPSASKNQNDYINILHQGNINPNSINPFLYQSGNGGHHGAGQSGNQAQGPETFHVFTDGSPIHLEHLLQHIQQADHNLGPYAPFVTQPHQMNIPNRRPDNENITTNNVNTGAGSFPVSPGFGNAGSDNELQVVNLDAISPTSVRIVLSLPPVMVGLQGRVKLRYTDSSNPASGKSWKEQEFAPPNDVLASQQMEIQLESLQPNTLYYLEATVVLPLIRVEKKTQILSIRTLPYKEETTIPPVIYIEPNLAVGHVNSSSAQVLWRSFTPDETHYIDGIQLRYREIDGKVFSGTPLIHRAITSYQLDGLKPTTSYEVGIYFIPFLGQQTELQSPTMVRFNTTAQIDMYDWNVFVDVDGITPYAASVKWSGVPSPAEKFVHVYRVVWRAEVAQIDASSFSIPTRDSVFEANITGLAPGTKYRIWLELYLTNGRIKTSNVKDIMTKPGKAIPHMSSSFEGKLLESSTSHQGDYYSSLVVVAILAALGAMCSLVLLLILVRRHRTASAPICSSTAVTRTTPALPPYDSPTYKLDLHQETMDL